MIRSEWFFWLVGLVFLAMSVQMVCDRTNPRRFGTAAFWGLLGLCFGYSTFVLHDGAPPQPLGVAVLVLVCLGGFGLTGKGDAGGPSEEVRKARAERFGNKLFLPALTIPFVAVLVASLVKKVHFGGEPLLEKGSETILGLGVAAIAAVAIGMVVLRERNPMEPLSAGRSMLEAMGWALLLPQLLAVLGSIFQAAGVGSEVGKLTEHVLPDGQRFTAVAVYCVGMAVFTMIMGNGFAAFPVLTAAVGWPVLIEQMHGNAPAVLAIGMLSGFCGTLATPMAANFNLVPAALLELKDRYGPIKAQLPTAGVLLGFNIVLMNFFAF